ncbi:MAG: cupredoxin domain-containing protein [Candidatus Levybacteria bacterium]|nr:cupredoxin domain-containing protein [Candidatus Levybacteria bacterium]
MKKILLLLVFVIASLILPINTSAHSEVRIIEMNENGFTPSEIMIDTDSTVIFVNKDTKPRWPASNVHPTHEIYPELDPRKNIDPEESWTFKPTKAGEWKYHDHNFPHMRGVIIVVDEDKPEEPSSPPNNILTKFKSFINNIVNKVKNLFKPKPKSVQQSQLPNKETFKNSVYDAQSKTLTEIAKANGPSASWKYIQDVFGNEAGSTGNIHDLAHLSGILIYEQKGFNGISDCSAKFAFGCYHGFLDKAFAKNLDHLLDAQDACLKLSSQAGTITGPAASCIHGIGHGIASFYRTSDLEKALITCRKLTSGNEYCFDGVFMEFVRSAPDTFFKNNDPYYPCNFLERKYGYSYSFACGRNQSSLLMGRYKMGFDEVVKVCINSNSSPFKNACIDSLGFSLASTGNTQQIITGCQKIGVDEFIAKCIKSAAGELVFQEVPGWSEKSLQVCNGVGFGQKECLEHIERLIKEYNRQAQINFPPKLASEAINSYTRKVMKTCYESDGRDGCYKKAADVLYSQFGLAKTLNIFKENEQFTEVYARCHETTHYLSRLEYEKQQSISKVYAQCDSTCHGGCYHGTLEAYLKRNSNANFAKVCGSENDYQKPIEFNECLHGMGHAAMFVTEMELKESLKLCDSISNQEHKERCYTGVFMENSSSSTSFDHVSRYIKKDDPFYPCNVLEEKYQSLCWQYQSSYFSIISNQDWKKVADLCLQIPQEYQDRCFRTIGTNQVGFTQSLETMKKDCDLMPSEHFKDVCVGGVVSSLSYRFVGNMQKMIDFCLLTDSQNREICFKQIGNGILDWDRNKTTVRKECSKIPDREGQSWCLSVI